MLGPARRTVRVAATVVILAAALFAGVVIWTHYVSGPWTRDGQVLVNVVNIAPEVSGRIITLHVADNQEVRRGDPLYDIDPVDYEVAVATAEANVNSRQADLKTKQEQAARRASLTTLSTSTEELQRFQGDSEIAAAAYASAVAQASQARIDLKRTHVVSPVDGYVTNLQLRQGDYATKGARNIAVVDRDSFWVVGYFEETKLRGIRVGDPAVAALMGYPDPVRGHVESVARGINTPNTVPGELGLATVNPVFTWVRLAQRIPVRIHIDSVPDTVHLAVGLTATVSVGPDAGAASPHGLISRLLTQAP